MSQVDFIKEHKDLYAPSSSEPSIINVPIFKFLTIDGKGNPNTSEEYKKAVEALYSVSYTIKFMPKKGVSISNFFEYKVGPLEGLWWMENNSDFVLENKDNWQWKMMIMQPEFVTLEVFNLALESARKKKPNTSLDLLKLEEYNEGLAVQLMHIGPYSEEHSNIIKMHDFATSQGYKLKGKHHEIYLGDPRKTAPEKLRTILRQPIVK